MSITLTTPALVNTILGGNTLVGYDHAVLSPITFNPVSNTINASIRITASLDPDQDVITGSLLINTGTGLLTLEVQQLDIRKQQQLLPGQITATLNIMSNAQDALESGLVSLGVVDGTQSTGT